MKDVFSCADEFVPAGIIPVGQAVVRLESVRVIASPATYPSPTWVPMAENVSYGACFSCHAP